MKKERVGEDSSIRTFIGRVYKVFGFWFSVLKTRLLGVSNESWNIVVFEKGIVTEVIA
jgi:hypothetical protein